jgi:hypothetical protein
MNFIDAAIAILEESRKALSVEDITNLAMERKLVTKPGKDPVRSMRARLEEELERGDESLVKQVGDRFRLEKAAEATPARAAKAAQKTGKATGKAAGKAAKAPPQAVTRPAQPAAKKAAKTAKAAPAATKAAPAATKAAGKTTKAAGKATKAAGKATTKATPDQTAAKTATQTATKTATRAADKAPGQKAATKAATKTATRAAKPARKEAELAPEAAAPAAPAPEVAAPAAPVPAARTAPPVRTAPAAPTPVSTAVGQSVPDRQAQAEPHTDRPGGKKKRRRRRGRGGGGGGGVVTSTGSATAATPIPGSVPDAPRRAPVRADGDLDESPDAAGVAPAADTARETRVHETRVHDAPAGGAPVDESPELGELLAPRQHIRRVAPAATPDEQDIEQIYGDELAGTEPGAAFAEYEDEQTDDEDRPMVPEMVADRRDRRKRERLRRSDRRQRRDRGEPGERDVRREGPAAPPAARASAERGPAERAPAERAPAERGPRPAERPPAERRARPAELAPLAESRADAPGDTLAAGEELAIVAPMGEGPIQDLYRPGTSVGDAAAEVLRGSRSDQPVQIKQLAQMMRKRQLINDDPAEVWPYIKAALLADEQRHRDLGLRPRIIYRGRDMFSVAPPPLTADLAEAEAALGQATYDLAEATHQALKQRLSSMDVTALERVAHVYLLASGWKGLQWIKRVQRSSYAVGTAPGGLGAVLIGVRGGSDTVDRRGVGELRVGVLAKGLTCGFLLAPQDLSEAGRSELGNKGPSVSVLVGDAFVAELVRCGIGTLRKSVPAVYFDEGFFAEIETT